MKRRQRGSGIPQQNRTYSCHKRGRASCFRKADSMITRSWLRNMRKFTGRFPVKPAAVHNGSPHGGTMSRMNDDIRAIRNRTYQIWSRKRVVDHKRYLMFMRNTRKRFNICDIGIGITHCLCKYRFRIFPDRHTDFLLLRRIHESCRNSILYQCMLQQIISPAINIFRRYNMISCKRQILNRISYRRCSGCDRQSSYTTLQLCHPLFKNILCRIRESAINISRICQVKTSLRMIAVMKHIRRCLIDRHCPRIRRRIRLFLPCMQL